LKLDDGAQGVEVGLTNVWPWLVSSVAGDDVPVSNGDTDDCRAVDCAGEAEAVDSVVRSDAVAVCKVAAATHTGRHIHVTE